VLTKRLQRTAKIVKIVPIGTILTERPYYLIQLYSTIWNYMGVVLKP